MARAEQSLGCLSPVIVEVLHEELFRMADLVRLSFLLALDGRTITFARSDRGEA